MGFGIEGDAAGKGVGTGAEVVGFGEAGLEESFAVEGFKGVFPELVYGVCQGIDVIVYSGENFIGDGGGFKGVVDFYSLAVCY